MLDLGPSWKSNTFFCSPLSFPLTRFWYLAILRDTSQWNISTEDRKTFCRILQLTIKQKCQVYFKFQLWSLLNSTTLRTPPSELQSYNVELCRSRIQSPAQITLLLLELHLGHIRRHSWRLVRRPTSPRTTLCGWKCGRGVVVVVVKEFEHWYVCIWYMYRYMCKL